MRLGATLRERDGPSGEREGDIEGKGRLESLESFGGLLLASVTKGNVATYRNARGLRIT